MKAKHKMYVIGLTGSIGMGKSTALSLIKKHKIPTHSADDAVHALLEKDRSVAAKIKKLFPEVKKISRAALGKIVFNDEKRREKLEKVLHPLVIKDQQRFITQNKTKGVVVLDIPLLFETGAEKRCDLVLCVSASKKKQKERVMARKGMTPALFKAILDRQIPDEEKRKRADVVLMNNADEEGLEQQIKAFLVKLEFGYFAKKTRKRR